MIISKDVPISEIVLRKYENPSFKDRDLVRKLCLSIGLLQPGDSRDVVVDVFHVLLKNRESKTALSSEDIKSQVIELRKQSNLPLLGIASSNIRRQLRRLKELFLIESNANYYHITEWEKLKIIFDEKIRNFMVNTIVKRVGEYFEEIDRQFPHHEDKNQKKDETQ